MVREISTLASNWRSMEQAEEFLSQYNMPVVCDIDTRALVRHLRSRGVMRGIVAPDGGDPKGWWKRRVQFRR